MVQTINKQSAKLIQSEAVALPGSEDYYYYGAAKDLPKVRELIEKTKKLQAPPKSYEELNKKVGYEYYIFETDDATLQLEKAIEDELRQKALEDYAQKHNISVDKLVDKSYQPAKRQKVGENEGEEFALDNEMDDIEEFENIHSNPNLQTATSNQLETRITADDIKKLILQKKKEALIKKYASEAADEAQVETTNLKINEI